MTIKIDQSIFLPKIKTYSENAKRRREFKEQIVDLSRDVMDEAQGWFDEAPWVDSPIEHFDTQRECRVELSRHISRKIDLSDHKRSWFVPNFVFIWLANQLVTYILKLIIEHYWGDLSKEIGIDH
jgi:hypothetical protein